MFVLRGTPVRHIRPSLSIFTSRKSSSMANKDLRGHLLCTIPFPEPKPIIERIRQTYPNLNVTFTQPGERVSDG